jgi:hypothetical protein
VPEFVIWQLLPLEISLIVSGSKGFDSNNGCSVRATTPGFRPSDPLGTSENLRSRLCKKSPSDVVSNLSFIASLEDENFLRTCN